MCFSKPGRVGFEYELDLVPHPAELLHDFVLRAGCMSGVVKSPMVAMDLAGKHRAGLLGVAADRDDGIDPAAQEGIHVL